MQCPESDVRARQPAIGGASQVSARGRGEFQPKCELCNNAAIRRGVTVLRRTAPAQPRAAWVSRDSYVHLGRVN